MSDERKSAELTEREKELLLTEVGQRFAETRRRIREIEERALRKLPWGKLPR